MIDLHVILPDYIVMIIFSAAVSSHFDLWKAQASGRISSAGVCRICSVTREAFPSCTPVLSYVTKRIGYLFVLSKYTNVSTISNLAYSKVMETPLVTLLTCVWLQEPLSSPMPTDEVSHYRKLRLSPLNLAFDQLSFFRISTTFGTISFSLHFYLILRYLLDEAMFSAVNNRQLLKIYFVALMLEFF